MASLELEPKAADASSPQPRQSARLTSTFSSDGWPDASSSDSGAVPSTQAASAAYRADIDGLRAVAVVAVILFHLDPALLPGGFMGVDVCA